MTRSNGPRAASSGKPACISAARAGATCRPRLRAWRGKPVMWTASRWQAGLSTGPGTPPVPRYAHAISPSAKPISSASRAAWTCCAKWPGPSWRPTRRPDCAYGARAAPPARNHTRWPWRCASTCPSWRPNAPPSSPPTSTRPAWKRRGPASTASGRSAAPRRCCAAHGSAARRPASTACARTCGARCASPSSTWRKAHIRPTPRPWT